MNQEGLKVSGWFCAVGRVPFQKSGIEISRPEIGVGHDLLVNGNRG
jgi:hypothetical protein